VFYSWISIIQTTVIACGVVWISWRLDEVPDLREQMDEHTVASVRRQDELRELIATTNVGVSANSAWAKTMTLAVTDIEYIISHRKTWMDTLTEWIKDNVSDRFPRRKFEEWTEELAKLNPTLVLPEKPSITPTSALPPTPD